MKIICTFLTLILASPFYSQISAGQITYEIRIIEKAEIYGYYHDKDPMDSTVRESSYTIDFNEKFIRSFATIEDMNAYMTLQDKSTGKMYVGTLQEDEKTIHFLDINSSEPDYSDYGYYDEETDEEPEIGQYHEDFYKDLMRIPLNDTIVIHTDETKDILGFSCKKTIMKIKGETMIVWTTEQIKGIEQMYNFPKQVRGTVLELNSKRKGYEVSYKATFFSTQTTLNNDGPTFIPEDYRLDLGSTYMESYTKNEYLSDPNFSIPSFIDASNYEEVLTSVLKEVDNVNHSKVKEEYDYSFFVIRIDIDEQGKIVSVEPEEEPENAHIDWKKLNKNVKKNCAFKQPVTMNGKAIPSVITINYSYINRQKEADPDRG